MTLLSKNQTVVGSSSVYRKSYINVPGWACGLDETRRGSSYPQVPVSARKDNSVLAFDGATPSVQEAHVYSSEPRHGPLRTVRRRCANLIAAYLNSTLPS